MKRKLKVIMAEEITGSRITVRQPSPPDPLKDRPEALPSRRINRLDESHPAVEVRTKIDLAGAVLALGAKPRTIGQCCFEQIEIPPPDIHMPIDDQAGEVLAHSLAHDSGLAVIYSESFLK
jgi:hypothetical protein